MPKGMVKKETKIKGMKGNNNNENVKITICHIPPGNPNNKRTLTISTSALQAHINHGDVMGSCDESSKGTSDKDTGDKDTGDKDTTNVQDQQGGDKEYIVYGTVKATVYHYSKTIRSAGVMDFRIIDANTEKILTVEKMPGEFIWFSEWATFNGDERALTEEQLELSKQKEIPPLPPQDLFTEFTRPIFDQIINKVKNYYRNY